MKSDHWGIFYKDFVTMVNWHPFLAEALGDCAPRGGRLDNAAELIDLHPRLKAWFDRFHAAGKSRFLDDEEEETEGEGEEKKTIIRTDKILRLIGRSASRNTVGALIVLDEAVEQRPKEEQGALQIKDYLTFSVELQEFCEEHRLPHSEMVFEAGLALDVLQATSKGRNDWKLDLARVRTLMGEGVNAGQLMILLGQKLKRFTLERYAFGCAVWWIMGRVSLSLLFPMPNAEFEKDWPFWKNHLFPESWEILERKHYGITFRDIASCLAYASRSYSGAASAIRGDSTPLSVLFDVATTLALFDREGMNTVEDLPLSPLQKQALKNLGLTPKHCLEAIKALRTF